MAITSGPPCPPVDIAGHLLYPPYATPIPHTSVDITVITINGIGTIERFTDAWNQFHLKLAPTSPEVEYWVTIRAEGMEPVRQKLFVPRECGPGPGIDLNVLLHSAIKPSETTEDTVAIENLKRKIPQKVVHTFEQDTKAVSALQDVIKTAPDYYDANLALGLEYKKQNKPEDSRRTLAHALEVNPGSMLARAALGEYAFEANDFQNAQALLSEAVRLGNISPDVYYMLGTSYYKLNRLDLAEACLLRALSISSIGKAYLQLYNVYMKSKMPDKALKSADTYLEKYPDAEDRVYVRSMADKLRKALKPY